MLTSEFVASLLFSLGFGTKEAQLVNLRNGKLT